MDGTYFWDVKRAMIMTIELPSKNVQHQVETFVEFNNRIGKIQELVFVLISEKEEHFLSKVIFSILIIASIIDSCFVVIDNHQT